MRFFTIAMALILLNVMVSMIGAAWRVNMQAPADEALQAYQKASEIKEQVEKQLGAIDPTMTFGDWPRALSLFKSVIDIGFGLPNFLAVMGVPFPIVAAVYLGEAMCFIGAVIELLWRRI